MNPLPSTDWPALKSLDKVTGAICEHLALLSDDALKGMDYSDYEQLRKNIAWLKSGFEQAERVLIDARERARASAVRRRLGEKSAKESSELES